MSGIPGSLVEVNQPIRYYAVLLCMWVWGGWEGVRFKGEFLVGEFMRSLGLLSLESFFINIGGEIQTKQEEETIKYE